MTDRGSRQPATLKSVNMATVYDVSHPACHTPTPKVALLHLGSLKRILKKTDGAERWEEISTWVFVSLEQALAAEGLRPLCSASWGQDAAFLHFKRLSPLSVCERCRFPSGSRSSMEWSGEFLIKSDVICLFLFKFADSFNFNPHKWLLVNFDCSAMW